MVRLPVVLCVALVWMAYSGAAVSHKYTHFCEEPAKMYNYLQTHGDSETKKWADGVATDGAGLGDDDDLKEAMAFHAKHGTWPKNTLDLANTCARAQQRLGKAVEAVKVYNEIKAGGQGGAMSPAEGEKLISQLKHLVRVLPKPLRSLGKKWVEGASKLPWLAHRVGNKNFHAADRAVEESGAFRHGSAPLQP